MCPAEGSGGTAHLSPSQPIPQLLLAVPPLSSACPANANSGTPIPSLPLAVQASR